MSIQNAYNQWSNSYDEDGNLTRDLDQKVIRETLAHQHFNAILEIGCGTGKNTLFLNQPGTTVHAIDFSQGMIDKAREKVKAKNVRFSMADLTKTWPCENEAYDLVVCCLVLEHIEDLSHVFAEAARTLIPKGWLLINELHPFKQYKGARARFAIGKETIEVDAFVHHISDFTNAAMASGLRLIKLNEYWHESDQNMPPRLVSFLFGNEREQLGN